MPRSCGPAGDRVAGGVVWAQVGLCFDNTPANRTGGMRQAKDRAKQVAGDERRLPRVERSDKRRPERGGVCAK